MNLSPSGPGRVSTTTPRWIQLLIRRIAPAHRVEETIGDLEETHRRRRQQHGRIVAVLLTAYEALEMVLALLRERVDERRARRLATQEHVMKKKQRVSFMSVLDFKLGLRMVARYPSLTTVAVLAMAFGITIGTAAFEWLKTSMFPPLPYANAAQIVALQNFNLATARTSSHVLHDFEPWRAELKTVTNLSALRVGNQNLMLGDETALPVSTAEVSASAFRLLRGTPLLGRTLLSSDELAEAPPVTVLGYDVWQEKFAGARDIVGKHVRLGNELTTVVGVMPRNFSFFVPREGLTFPAAQDLWVPMRLRSRDYPTGEGPGLAVFGELVKGVPSAQARAELKTISMRLAALSPQTHQYVTTQLLTFALPFSGNGALFPTVAITLGTAFMIALMVVICGNVALLLFARAATREREIAIRSALGASRSSIVAQLFAEALVLAAVAIVVGLAGASVVLKWGVRTMALMMQAEGLTLPTWAHANLSLATIGYAALLAIVGAAVAGVLPGLRVTGKKIHSGTQRFVGSGGSGVRLGGVWTAIVITQVALTAMLVPIAIVFGIQTRDVRNSDRTLPSGNYLSVRLGLDGDADVPVFTGATRAVATRAVATRAVATRAGASTALTTRFEQSYRTLARRLSLEPGVAGVTIARQLPGSMHDGRLIQTDALSNRALSNKVLSNRELRNRALSSSELSDSASWERRAQIAWVDINFFDVLQTPIIAGRKFSSVDSMGGQRSVIVNESFVREHLGGGNAVGRQVRYLDADARDGAGAWYTIVGVVRDVAMTIDPAVSSNAGVYHVLPSTAHDVEMAVRLTGNPAAFSGRLNELAAEVAPTLRIDRVIPLDQAGLGLFITYDAWFRAIVLCGLMAILLTNAGIYAVISFTVARRTREIGVRVALGAQRSQVIAVVLARATRHVGIGVGIGAAFGTLLTFSLKEDGVHPTVVQSGIMLGSYVTVMMTVCLLACIVPAWRALRIEPTVALGAEG